METKPIKLSPKKNGYGNISSYSINIGATEAKECSFINNNGIPHSVEKIIDPKNKQIIIRLKAAE